MLNREMINKRIQTGLLNSLIVSSLLISLMTAAEENVTAYRGMTWLNVKQQVMVKDALVIVKDHKISYIGKNHKIDDTIHTIDMTGKYLLPGFFDTHAHFSMGAISVSMQDGQPAMVAAAKDDISQWNGQKMLAHGITQLRNPGGDTQHNVTYKQQVAKQQWIGPDAHVAGLLLDKTSMAGLTYQVKKNQDIVDEIVRQKQLGVDFIKLYTGLNESELELAINTAHQHGLKAIGHIDNVSWTRAAELGIDGLVHAMPTSLDHLTKQQQTQYNRSKRPGAFTFFEWFEQVDLNSKPMKQMISTLKSHHVVLDPTLIVFKNAFWGDDKTVTENPQLSLVHPDLLKNWQSFYTFNLGWQANDFARAKKAWPQVLKLVKRFHQEGILMSIGTDVGNPWVIPGVSFHQEMALMVDAGISEFEVLKMATLNGALSTGTEHISGSLEVGKQANMVFLNHNPLADIDNTRSIALVVKHGTSYSSDVLLGEQSQ